MKAGHGPIRPGLVVWDGLVKGLHLRFGKRRSGYYLFYRTKAGQQRRPKLGDHPSMTLDSARKSARGLLERVALGEDPSGDWQIAKRELTVAEAFDLAWESHWNTQRYLESGHAKEVKRLYEAHIAGHFGNWKISQVPSSRVSTWHKGMASTPVEANRALEVLSRIYAIAIEQELIKINPAKVRAFTERKRERFASVEEIGRIGLVLRKHWDTEKRRDVAFILLLALTGARPTSIARARWEDVSDDWVLYLPGKSTNRTGELDKVVLCEPARKLLLEISVQEDGRLIGGPIPRLFWKQVCDEADVKGLWIRDWRRAVASIGLSAGISMDVIGGLLNHKSTQTTQRYAKVISPARKDAAERISTEMSRLLTA